MIICLLVVQIRVMLSKGDTMKWDDPDSGYSFDWSMLQRSYSTPWDVSDPSDYYFSPTKFEFNFGIDVPSICGGQSASVVEMLVINDFIDTCDVLGRHEMSSVRLINEKKPEKGIVLTYRGGEICGLGAGNTRMTTAFQLRCSVEDKAWEVLTDSILDPCHLVLRKFTPAACPVNGISQSTRNVLFYLAIPVCGLLIYLVGGLLINIAKGHRGIEAIPHYEFWRSIPHNLCDKFQGYANKSSNSKSYEEI